MTFTPTSLYPPQPTTTRAQTSAISYDGVNKRIAYVFGRSVFVKSADIDAPNSFQFTKHSATTTAVAFSPSGNYIASGDETGNVKVWDVSVYSDTNRLKEQPLVKSEFPVLSGPVRAIAWDADSSRIIAVGEGKERYGACFSWDSGNSVGEIQGHADTLNSVDIKPNRPYRAVTAGNDKAVVFYTGPPFKFGKSIRGIHTNIVQQVKFSPDGAYFASVGSDRLVVVYDGKTGEVVRQLADAHEGAIYGVSWKGSDIVTCSSDGSVKLWSDALEQKKQVFVGDKTVQNQLVGVVVAGDYTIAISLSGNLHYVDFDSESVRVVAGHHGAITASVVSDGSLYTGSSDGSIFRWKLDGSKLEEPVLVGNHDNYVADLIYAENLVSIGWDDKLKVWGSSGLVKEVQLPSQPKKLIANGEIQVLFADGIKTYTKDLETNQETSLGYDASDVDLLGQKLLVTNLSSNKLEEASATLKFEAVRGTPAIVRVSPDNQYIALGDSAGKYIIYNADASVKTTRWTYHTSRVLDAKWSPDSKFLLSGGLDSSVMIYSISRVSKVLQFPLAHQSGVTRVEWLSYDEDVAVVATTGLDGVVKVWDVELSGLI